MRRTHRLFAKSIRRSITVTFLALFLSTTALLTAKSCGEVFNTNTVNQNLRDGSERVQIASAEPRNRVATAPRARAARSLPMVKTQFSLGSLTPIILDDNFDESTRPLRSSSMSSLILARTDC